MFEGSQGDVAADVMNRNSPFKQRYLHINSRVKDETLPQLSTQILPELVSEENLDLDIRHG